MVKWNDKDINEPHMIDSSDFSQDTMEIKLDDINKSLKKKDSIELTREFEEYEKYIRDEKHKRKKTYIIFSIAMVVLVSVISFFALSYVSKITSWEKEAVECYNKGDYQQAATIYQNLYEETGDKEYGKEFRHMEKCRENEDLLFEASEDIRMKDYENAVEVLLTIASENDKTIEKINAELKKASDFWLEDILKYYHEGDIKNAYTEINRFVNLIPENEEANQLKMDILRTNKAEVGDIEKKDNLENKEEDKIKNRIFQKNYEKSRAMIGTEQYVVTNTANIRSRHNINAPVIDTVKKGVGLYIEDTFLDKKEGFWCKVTYYSDRDEYVSGWISYTTLKGDI